jgi:N6-adenosine-specific RNA methylase IME4
MHYATMSLEAIGALPVDDIAEPDAHLYLWTTQMYLRDAYDVVEAWGFGRPSSVLVWSKSPKGLSRSAFVCSAEFVLFARRGTLPTLDRNMGTVFDWPRQFLTGSGSTHSAKPEAFLDMVERMSPGPRLEMFARRARLDGWDYWGDESLGTAEMPERVA